MVVPLIFVTTITLKEGKLEDFKHYSEQMGKFVEENEPRIIHFEQYINEDGTEMTSVQIHPDEDSMRSTCRWPANVWPKRPSQVVHLRHRGTGKWRRPRLHHLRGDWPTVAGRDRLRTDHGGS